MNPEVPLTIFTAFVSSTGAAQVAKVQEAMEDYDPQTDYYLPFREAAERSIFTGDPAYIRRAAAKASPTRRTQYEACAAGMETWLEKTTYTVVDRLNPIRFTCGDLTINVTTDFVLRIEGQIVLLKPYLRQDPLSRDARNAFSYLVKETHGKLYPGTPKLLVARNAKLERGYPTKNAATILRAEADKFVSMWRSHRVA